MSRETSPFVYGEYWLDQRRDGRASGIWQIASYSAKSRSVIYRSTRQAELEAAKPVLIAFAEKQKARHRQSAEDAWVVPQLLLYYDEHGANVTTSRGSITIAGSLRLFIGFLMQDETGSGATVADLNPQVFERFRRWRMGPHECIVPWKGKEYPHKSAGVRGETVQRNLDDIRAALNHAALNGRIPYAPKVPSVKQAYRSPPRDIVLTIKQLGAILGFVWDEPAMRRWVQIMIGTAARPDACLAFNPAEQWRGNVIDMHPANWKRTKKRNPVLPVIEPLIPVMKDWQAHPHKPVRSRRRQWATMRKALELPDAVVPKTIRHTIATELRARGVGYEETETVLGHRVYSKTTEVYAKYDPSFLAKAKRSLTMIFKEANRAADRWRADHLRTTDKFGGIKVIDRKAGKVEDLRGSRP